MLAGAAVFLRARTQRRGVIALLAASAAAFAVIGVGKYLIVPLQTWDGWFERHPVEIERWYEALSVIPTLFWMWVMLLLPLGWRPWIEREG